MLIILNRKCTNESSINELRNWHENQVLYRYLPSANCLDYKNILLQYKSNYLLAFEDDSGEKYLAGCDEDWLVWFRRRKINQGDGNFNLSYAKYEEGIYYSSDNYFTGLKYLHKYTENNSPVEMKVEMEFEGIKYYMLYKNLTIGDKNSGYIWNFDFDSGNSTIDSLSNHTANKFTTFDNDQDRYYVTNCASLYGGGSFCNILILF